MGAYLSEPVTNKVSSNEHGKRVDCGASSMQGWRVSQEDAHNCILEFDEDTSFFAVYDGHGGHEVAEYCAAHLPQFLKECENYTKGEFIEALQEAFLGFDAKLATPEVVAVLKEISGKKDVEDNSGSDAEENICNLKEEAEMPLDEVMAKYKKDLNPHLKNVKPAGKDKSPYIWRRTCIAEASGSGVSSCSSTANDITTQDNTEGTGQNSINIELKVPNSEADKIIDSAISNSNGNSASEKLTNKAKEEEEESDTSKNVGDTQEQSSFIEREKAKTENEKNEDVNRSTSKKLEFNGEVGASGDDKKLAIEFEAGEVLHTPPPHENGVAPYEGKGKGKAIIAKEDSNAKAKNYMALRRHAAAALYKSLLGPQDNSSSDSDSDDDGDESFEGAADSSDDVDDGEDNEEEGEEEEEDEDDESMVDDEDDDDEDDFTMKMTEEPGSDSGCTAVVALLHGRELYVANAGDSRCVVCRNGQAVEMSLDHKPEDELEMQRIVKAGGKVTADGRVNGGLNLSRALGDHAYKLNSKLPAQEQMITALPDVRTLILNPEEDEFIILACDGIWNFMSSQEVCDFVRPRLQKEAVQLSHICEELFDHCLAPNTLGDGTGCDNMTAVLVQVKPTLADIAESKSIKRLASPDKNIESAKRPKTEETV